MKRVLLTELGNSATGDPALWAETVSRLQGMGAEVTLLHRMADTKVFEDFEMGAIPRVQQMLPLVPHELDSVLAVVSFLKKEHPVVYSHLLEMILQHDVVAIAPGGKFLQEYAYPQALLASCVGLEAQKTVLILHQSIGPLELDARSRLLSEVIQKSDLVLIRDEESYKFVTRNLLKSSPNIRLTRDPLLALSHPDPASPTFDIGVNFRLQFNGWSSNEDLIQFLQLVKRKRPHDRILLYTTTHDLDEALLTEVENLQIPCLPKTLVAADMHRVPASCALNLTDSFHGAIFSMTSGRPVVICQSDFGSWKLQGTFLGGGIPNRIHPGPVNPRQRKSLIRVLEKAVKNPARWLERQTRDLTSNREKLEMGWDEVMRIVSQ